MGHMLGTENLTELKNAAYFVLQKFHSDCPMLKSGSFQRKKRRCHSPDQWFSKKIELKLDSFRDEYLFFSLCIG